MEFAPIVLFVYNRPKHTKLVLDALALNFGASESNLFVFADGAKNDSDLDQIRLIDETLSVVSEETRFKKKYINKRPENYGLHKNILEGISEVFKQYESLIVLEDDIVPSLGFLKFCNDALNIYKDVNNVFSINGFQHPILTDRLDSVLLPLTSTWGWATWRHKWEIIYPSFNERKLLTENRWLKSRFNLADYDYTHMLRNEKSWGIKWHFTVFLKGGLGLFPTISLVSNIGFDGTGENSGKSHNAPKITDEILVLDKKNLIDLEFYGKLLCFFEKNEPKFWSLIFFRNFLKKRFRFCLKK